MAWLREAGGAELVARLEPDRASSLGRSPDCDLVLAGDMKVSRRHAEVLRRQGEWWVRDLGSRNGTRVNGEPVSQVMLAEGDRLKIGDHEFVFTDVEDPLATIDESSRPPAPDILSPRESEILAWVASGATDIQISRALDIKVATVQSHLDRIREKTGRRRRPDLTRLALELGLRLQTET